MHKTLHYKSHLYPQPFIFDVYSDFLRIEMYVSVKDHMSPSNLHIAVYPFLHFCNWIQVIFILSNKKHDITILEVSHQEEEFEKIQGYE